MNRAQQKAPLWIFFCQRLIEYLEPQSCKGMTFVTCHLNFSLRTWKCLQDKSPAAFWLFF